MLEALRDLFSFSQRKEGNIKADQGGQFLGGIGIWLVTAIAGVFGIGLLSTIDWAALLGVMVIVVVGLSVVGAIWFKVPFKYVLVIAMICLALVFVLEIGPLTAIGALVIGGAFYMFGGTGLGGNKMWIFLALVGAGSIMAIWGLKFVLIPMGIYP